jgi:hypothetical protein
MLLGMGGKVTARASRRKNSFEKLRHSHRPCPISVLFIGESAPPSSGKFFYSGNSVLYRAMKKAFGGRADFLTKFKSKGYFLDDLVLFPADNATAEQRKQYLENCQRDLYRKNIPSLARRIKKYRPQGILILLSGVKFENAVLMALEKANRRIPDGKVEHYGTTPFPNRFHLESFLKKMRKIIRKLKVRSKLQETAVAVIVPTA